jgi:hypothetical protein
MKLTDIDKTILDEGILDYVKAGIGTLGYAAGYDPAKKYANELLEKNHFMSGFVQKMSGMLATVWPKVTDNKEKFSAAEEKQKLFAQNKPVIFSGVTVQPGDPRYSTAKSQNDRILKAGPLDFNMASYLMEVIKTYCQGVDISAQQGAIQGLCQQVEAAYPETRGIKELRGIGELIYGAIKKAEPKTPTPQEQATSAIFKNMMANLSKLKEEELKDLIAAAQKQQQAMY